MDRAPQFYDAGADFVTTQIVYDAERLAGWADAMRPRGLLRSSFVAS